MSHPQSNGKHDAAEELAANGKQHLESVVAENWRMEEEHEEDADEPEDDGPPDGSGVGGERKAVPRKAIAQYTPCQHFRD